MGERIASENTSLKLRVSDSDPTVLGSVILIMLMTAADIHRRITECWKLFSASIQRRVHEVNTIISTS
jgi:hypothetical protein